MAARKQRTTAPSAASKERQTQALALRRSRASYAEIAQAMGLSGPGAAYTIVQRAMANLGRDDMEQIRDLEMLRLDDMGRRVLQLFLNPPPLVQGGKPVAHPDPSSGLRWLPDVRAQLQAADVLLRYDESFRKLVGADAPKQVEHSGPAGGPIPLEQVADDVMARARQLRGLMSAIEVTAVEDEAQEA